MTKFVIIKACPSGNWYPFYRIEDYPGSRKSYSFGHLLPSDYKIEDDSYNSEAEANEIWNEYKNQIHVNNWSFVKVVTLIDYKLNLAEMKLKRV